MRAESRQLLNWALALSEYDHKIQYIPSKNNGISGCLSHLNSVNLVSEFKLEFSIQKQVDGVGRNWM